MLKHWRNDVAEFVRKHGHDDLWDYLRANPGVSLVAVAKEIGGVAAVQLEGLVVQECLARRQMGELVRDLPARVVLIERPGAAQANLFTGRLVPPRSSPDWESGHLATELLAGTYTARLNANLRIRRSITYFARGHLQARRGPSDVELFCDVPIASAPLAVAETLREVEGMVTRPPGATEINLARNELKSVIAEQFATNGDAVIALRHLVLEKLPLDHYAVWPRRLDALDGKDLVAAARRYLDRAMTVVIVGPPALGDALAKAGLGPIERLAADELAR